MDRFVAAWQQLPAHISPSLFDIGSFQFRYYSLMYLLAFGLSYILILYRIKREDLPYTAEAIQDFLFWAIFGLILGGRLGYALFYNPSYYLHHPLEILLPFEFENGIRYVGISGMSYHGGAMGVILAAIVFCRRQRLSVLQLGDLIAPVIPLGYTFGRLGNFLNGELFGRTTTAVWGMYFPMDPTHQLRHPSQLYEALFEGVVLFSLLWFLRRKKYFDGFFVSLYIMGYGFVRFFIEFFREPDAQLGFVLGPFSMGQVLCVIMMLCGLGLLIYGRSRRSVTVRPASSKRKKE